MSPAEVEALLADVESRPSSSGMRSACDEYACPCHEAAPKLAALVREQDAEIKRLRAIERIFRGMEFDPDAIDSQPFSDHVYFPTEATVGEVRAALAPTETP